MSKMFFQLIVFFYSSIILAETNPIQWPLPDWQESPDSAKRMESNTCKAFQKFSTKNPQFLTDGLIVIKDGLIQYEYYDSNTTKDKPHALWSVTKTITGALLGIAVNEGRLSLESHLIDYYPRSIAGKNYKKLVMSNLLYFDSGFDWNEGTLDVNKNHLINMLYGEGHKDMASFATNVDIIRQGPGYKWTYSTGTPTITMGVLKKIYNDQYPLMPWRNLFHPLNMSNMVFEKDQSGTYNGGAGAYATPRDLAKIGYLYLNNGVWNNQIVLSPEWIKAMLTPSPGYLSDGTVVTNISEDGVYGGSIWLNTPVKKGFGKPYPYSPTDMYFALGFKGQLLIMLPTQKMIIVRTGYDTEFNSRIDEFVTRAISCFHDPQYKIGKQTPVNPVKVTLGTIIKNAKSAIEANTLQSSIAKNMCSCHFVMGLDIPTCIERNQFQQAHLLTKMTVRKNLELSGKYSIQVSLARFARLFKLHFGDSVKAVYDPVHPEYGCQLK